MRERRTAAVTVGLSLVLVFGGCASTTRSEADRAPSAELDPAAGSCVLRLRREVAAPHLADGAAASLRRRIGRERPDVRFVDGEEFRDALFPWFEPGTAPVSQPGMAELVRRPLVRETLEALGVRYLLVVGGGVRTIVRDASLATAHGVIGGMSRRETADYGLVVWDLRAAKKVTTFGARAKAPTPSSSPSCRSPCSPTPRAGRSRTSPRV